MMLRRALLIALAPLLMAQAPASPTANDLATPAVAPVAAEFNTEPQTGTGEIVLFSQEARVIGAVRVDAPVSATIPIGNSSIQVDVRAGAELYPVALQQMRDMRAFCSTQTTMNVTNPTRPPLIARTCLADTNGDRVFDNIGYMQVNVTIPRSATGQWQTPIVPRVGGGQVFWLRTQIASPAPFTPLQTHSIAPIIVDVTARPLNGIALVEMKSREGDARAQLNDQRENVRAEYMPRTINVHGAQVELQSLTDDALTYRVINGFPTEHALAFAFRPAPAQR
jgi:hypothetical protein